MVAARRREKIRRVISTRVLYWMTMILPISYPTVTWPITNLCRMGHLAIRLSKGRLRIKVRQPRNRDVSPRPHSLNRLLVRIKIRVETLMELLVAVKISNRHMKLPLGSGVALNVPISNLKRQVVYQVQPTRQMEPKITYHFRK